MKKKQRGRPRLRPLGPVQRLVINVSAPEGGSIRQAAKRAKLSVAAWCRSVLVPVALNALADVAAKSNVLDKIQQETKVAEGTFKIS